MWCLSAANGRSRLNGWQAAGCSGSRQSVGDSRRPLPEREASAGKPGGHWPASSSASGTSAPSCSWQRCLRRGGLSVPLRRAYRRAALQGQAGKRNGLAQRFGEARVPQEGVDAAAVASRATNLLQAQGAAYLELDLATDATFVTHR
ncbi:MAG: hypothetical protein MZV70_17070 [Desulfobacterales bacterium]|nr:hypothetical protein [Desulfobacterales bacterium]